jgi:hypothetical protein
MTSLTRSLPAITLAAVVALIAAPSPSQAACTTGTELIQNFPTVGPAVSQWHLCWNILRMPREGVARFGEDWTNSPIYVTLNHGPTTELRARDLPAYVSQENVEGQDVVVWYTDTHNHESNMRDEDRDAVPTEWVGFRLEPQNVWDGTPFY